MAFNPEDEQNFGPHCRNCHKGSSGCGTCHSADADSYAILTKDASNFISSTGPQDLTNTANNTYGASGSGSLGSSAKTSYNLNMTSTDGNNATAKLFETALVDSSGTMIPGKKMPGADGGGRLDVSSTGRHFNTFKKSQTVVWDAGWRTSAAISSATCSDDGFSWPHRTLGWKMLKDDLFGLDFNGDVIGVGDVRTYDGKTTNSDGESLVAHDLDSVCLDCHNPTIWNDGQIQTKDGHVDSPSSTTDNHNDELLTRGLP